MVIKKRVFLQSDLAVRWDVSVRTVQRWRKGLGGKLPPADVRLPSGRTAWSDTLIETIEQGGEATAA